MNEQQTISGESSQTGDEVPKSGNYFGWRFSFFGLGVILFTLAMYLIFGKGEGADAPLLKDTIEQGEPESNNYERD